MESVVTFDKPLSHNGDDLSGSDEDDSLSDIITAVDKVTDKLGLTLDTAENITPSATILLDLPDTPDNERVSFISDFPILNLIELVQINETVVVSDSESTPRGGPDGMIFCEDPSPDGLHQETVNGLVGMDCAEQNLDNHAISNGLDDVSIATAETEVHHKSSSDITDNCGENLLVHSIESTEDNHALPTYDSETEIEAGIVAPVSSARTQSSEVGSLLRNGTDTDDEIPESIQIQSMVSSPFPIIPSLNSVKSDVFSSTTESEFGLEYTSVVSTTSVNSEPVPEAGPGQRGQYEIIIDSDRDDMTCTKLSDEGTTPTDQSELATFDTIPVPSAVIRRDSDISLSSSECSTEMYHSECQVMTFRSAEDNNSSSRSSICSDTDILESVGKLNEMKRELFTREDAKEYLDILQSMEVDAMAAISHDSTNCDLMCLNEEQVDDSNIKAFVDSQIRVAIAKTLVSEQISVAMCQTNLAPQKEMDHSTLSSNTVVSDCPATVSSYPSSDGELKLRDVSLTETQPVNCENLSKLEHDETAFYSVNSSSSNSLLSSRSPGEVNDMESGVNTGNSSDLQNEACVKENAHVDDIPEGTLISALPVTSSDEGSIIQYVEPESLDEDSEMDCTFALNAVSDASISGIEAKATIIEDHDASDLSMGDVDLVTSTPKQPESKIPEIPTIIIDPSSEASGKGASNQIYSDSSSLSEEDGFCESEAMQSILNKMTGITNQTAENDLNSSSFSSSSMSTRQTGVIDSSEVYPNSTDETDEVLEKEEKLKNDSSAIETADQREGNDEQTPTKSCARSSDDYSERGVDLGITLELNTNYPNDASPENDITDEGNTADDGIKNTRDSLSARMPPPKTPTLRLFLKTKWPKRDPVVGKSFVVACKVRMTGFTLKDKDLKNSATVSLYKDNELLTVPGKFIKGYFVHKIKKPTVFDSGYYRYVVNLLNYEASEEKEINILPKGSSGSSNVRSISSIGSLGSLGSLFSLNNKSSRIDHDNR